MASTKDVLSVSNWQSRQATSITSQPAAQPLPGSLYRRPFDEWRYRDAQSWSRRHGETQVGLACLIAEETRIYVGDILYTVTRADVEKLLLNIGYNVLRPNVTALYRIAARAYAALNTIPRGHLEGFFAGFASADVNFDFTILLSETFVDNRINGVSKTASPPAKVTVTEEAKMGAGIEGNTMRWYRLLTDFTDTSEAASNDQNCKYIFVRVWRQTPQLLVLNAVSDEVTPTEATSMRKCFVQLSQSSVKRLPRSSQALTTFLQVDNAVLVNEASHRPEQVTTELPARQNR
ncbi:hypothetical protein N0V86_003035 [Didymella sp. IMI 355093]|nr:hypothetical protein N0V86_003035 [Didymella sp. IMI 355093]